MQQLLMKCAFVFQASDKNSKMAGTCMLLYQVQRTLKCTNSIICAHINMLMVDRYIVATASLGQSDRDKVVIHQDHWDL